MEGHLGSRRTWNVRMIALVAVAALLIVDLITDDTGETLTIIALTLVVVGLLDLLRQRPG